MKERKLVGKKETGEFRGVNSSANVKQQKLS